MRTSCARDERKASVRELLQTASSFLRRPTRRWFVPWHAYPLCRHVPARALTHSPPSSKKDKANPESILFAERFVSGEFIKHNSNSGWVSARLS